MARKKCPQCHLELDPEYVFCPECGTRLPAVSAVEQPAEPPVASAPPPAAPEAPHPEPPRETPPKTLSGSARFRIIRMARGGGQRSEYEVPDRGLVFGRLKADITFPEDETVSPRHATLKPMGDHVVLEDAGSLNGLFVRLKTEHRLVEGDVFLCGDQVFRVSLHPGRFHPMDWALYAAPQEPKVLATVTHVLANGVDGQTYAVRVSPFVIGREEGAICFGTDRFMSRKHAAIQQTPSGLVLADLKSRNGTYLCRRGSLTLVHGDIFMIGRQILRVEAVTS